MSPRRAWSLAPAAVAAALVLGACASAGDPAAPAGAASSPSPSPGASAGPASAQELAAAAARWGSAPRYVLTTSAEGYVAVPMAAGAYGADGFSTVFSDPTVGGVFLLTAVGGSLSAGDCEAQPLLDVTGGTVDGPVTCEAGEAGLVRTAGDAAEVAVARGDVLVRLSGAAADEPALREAATNLRVPTHDELVTLLAEAPRPGDPAGGGPSGGPSGETPVERGDLPPGDGAPDNGVGAGG